MGAWAAVLCIWLTQARTRSRSAEGAALREGEGCPRATLEAGVQRAKPFAGAWDVPTFFCSRPMRERTRSRSAEGGSPLPGCGMSPHSFFFLCRRRRRKGQAELDRALAAQRLSVDCGRPHYGCPVFIDGIKK